MTRWPMIGITLGLLACSGDDGTTDCPDGNCLPETDTDCVGTACDTDPPTSETGETGDTGTEPPSLSPLVNVTFLIQFGWDDTAGRTRSTTQTAVSTPSTLRAMFGTPTFDLDPGNTDEHCVVVFDLDGLSEAAFADAEGWWLGLELRPDPARVIEDSCTPRLGVDFTADSFVGSPAEDLAVWRFEVGIGDVGGVPTLGTTTFAYLIPGRVDVHVEVPGEIPDLTEVTPAVLGYAVDAGFVLRDDPAGGWVPLDPASVQTPGGVVDGLYEVIGVTYFGWP